MRQYVMNYCTNVFIQNAEFYTQISQYTFSCKIRACVFPWSIVVLSISVYECEMCLQSEGNGCCLQRWSISPVKATPERKIQFILCNKYSQLDYTYSARVRVECVTCLISILIKTIQLCGWHEILYFLLMKSARSADCIIQ